MRIAAVLMIFVLAACGGDGGSEAASESPTAAAAAPAAGVKGAAAAFRAPKNNAKVKSPVTVKMTAAKVEIEEAGVARKGAGHFHVIVDTKCVAKGKVIPDNAKHVHYGDASKTAKLKLKPGKHTLCLQLGNGEHTAFGRTDTVKITVKK